MAKKKPKLSVAERIERIDWELLHPNNKEKRKFFKGHSAFYKRVNVIRAWASLRRKIELAKMGLDELSAADKFLFDVLCDMCYVDVY